MPAWEGVVVLAVDITSSKTRAPFAHSSNFGVVAVE
jgi:hypothetical protein